jgi:hypothetical protein
MRRAGRPVPRPLNSPTPCWQCPKVPQAVKDAKGEVTAADALEPDQMHRDAVEQFLEYDAARAFPDDEWVRRNAFVIRPVKDAADAAPLRRLAALVALRGK